jgi:maleate isomerase
MRDPLVAVKEVVEALLVETRASRVTVRVDDPLLGLHVDDVAVEARADGVRSLQGERSIDQRAAATARWVELHRATLVQEDVATAAVRPPQALMGIYAVKAQMLAPMVREGRLVGWVSVHDVRRPRPWHPDQRAAAERAAAIVMDLLEQARREAGN